MTGRNDPCPCGSGKKYKNCCLSKDRAAHAQNLKAEQNPEPAEPVRLAPEPVLSFAAADTIEQTPEEDPFMTRINAFWEAFMEASYKQKWALVTKMLAEEPELCDGEMVFEITNALFSGAIDSGEIVRYKQLLDQLEQAAPEAHAEELHYILDHRIRIALIEGDEAAIERYFYQFSPLAGDQLDLYYRIVHALTYHGKLGILYEGMRQARPFVAEADALVEWAYREYTKKLGTLEILYRLDKNPDLQPDDPTLQQHFAEYELTPEPGTLATALDYRAGRKLPSWELTDFRFKKGRSTDNNVALLLAAFTYYAHSESGFPRTKVEMARDNLSEYIMQRQEGKLDPSDAGYGRAKRGSRKSKGESTLQNPFCPDVKTLDRYMVQLMRFMSFRFYETFALYELIPTWLRFLTQYNLLTEEARQQTIDEMRSLKADLSLIADKQMDDPAIRENLAAWPYDL